MAPLPPLPLGSTPCFFLPGPPCFLELKALPFPWLHMVPLFLQGHPHPETVIWELHTCCPWAHSPQPPARVPQPQGSASVRGYNSQVSLCPVCDPRAQVGAPVPLYR